MRIDAISSRRLGEKRNMKKQRGKKRGREGGGKTPRSRQRKKKAKKRHPELFAPLRIAQLDKEYAQLIFVWGVEGEGTQTRAEGE